MARVTVEDCVKIIPNRFELTLLAAHRARQISAGASSTVERNNDKNPVVALREIADESISIDMLKESMIRSMQRIVHHDEADTEEVLSSSDFDPSFLSAEDDLDDEELPERTQLDELESELSIIEEGDD